MNKNSVLITGGCGFIGSNLAKLLSNDNYKVTCLDNLSRKGSELLLHSVVEAGCKFIHGDIRNPEDFQKIEDEFDIMIECSAEPSVLVGSKGSDARFMINNNLTGSINCFEFCRERKMGVIFLSTSRIYPYDPINSLTFSEGNTRFLLESNAQGVSSKGIAIDFPLQGARSLYGATKLCSEYILQEYSTNYKIPSIINRCGVIAGPGQLGKVDQGVFTFWLLAHMFRKQINYIGFGGKGKQVRDLLHIYDLYQLIKKQIHNIDEYKAEIFNVGGSTVSNLSLLETSAICEEITGNRLDVGIDMAHRPADIIWYITDNGNTEDTFKWRPEKLPKVILTDIYNWINNNKEIKELFKK